jgi:hypothetical protein
MLCKTYSGRLCLPGSEIPDWICNQEMGSLISFRVPSSWDGKIGKVLVCVVYAGNKGKEAPPRELHDRRVWFEWRYCNKTRNPQKSYSLRHNEYMDERIYYFDSSEDHIFARVIKFNQVEFQMESGDEIGLSIDLGDMTEVKKCGIHLVDEPNVTRTGYWVEPLKYVLVGSEHDQY